MSRVDLPTTSTALMSPPINNWIVSDKVWKYSGKENSAVAQQQQIYIYICSENRSVRCPLRSQVLDNK